MKSLDDVILTLRFDEPDKETVQDAVEYLRDYKDLILMVRKIKKDFDFMTGKLIPESNEPLSWDELHNMIGKPVYELELNYGDGGHWKVIKDFEVDEYGNGFVKRKEEYVVYDDRSRMPRCYLNECFSLFRKEVLK